MPDKTNTAGDASTEATSDDAAPKAAQKKTTKKKSTARKTTGSKRASKSTSRAKTAAAAGSGTLRVRQIRSTIHKPKTFFRTLVALGIKHHQDEVVVKDTPAIRGMLKKVHHLVRVTPEES